MPLTQIPRSWHSGRVRGGGRKIYRHESNEGSVIEFDYWGSPMKLFVADAKYRGYGPKYDETGRSHGNPQLNGIAGFYNSYLNGTFEGDDPTVALPYTRNDAWIQSTYAALKNDGTARSNTDKLTAYSSARAAHHCRNQDIPGVGQLDLPNLYELIILYLESDNIDALDPTVESNRNKALGKMGTYGRFNVGYYSSVWSSTERDSRYAWCIGDGGALGYYNQDSMLSVVPVKELDA